MSSFIERLFFKLSLFIFLVLLCARMCVCACVWVCMSVWCVCFCLYFTLFSGFFFISSSFIEIFLIFQICFCFHKIVNEPQFKILDLVRLLQHVIKNLLPKCESGIKKSFADLGKANVLKICSAKDWGKENSLERRASNSKIHFFL